MYLLAKSRAPPRLLDAQAIRQEALGRGPREEVQGFSYGPLASFKGPELWVPLLNIIVDLLTKGFSYGI